MRPARFAAASLCTAVTSLSVGAAVGAMAGALDTQTLKEVFAFKGASAENLIALFVPLTPVLAILFTALVVSAVAARLVPRNERASLLLSGTGAVILAAGFTVGPLKEACCIKPYSLQITLGVAAALALVTLLSLASSFRGNFDTGAEHGNQRMAKMAEITALSDQRHFYNNFIWSQNAWQCHITYNKALRAAQDRRNLNEIAIGTSGMGKSYHCVIPNLLNSLGDSVVPLRTGGMHYLKNVFEHIRSHFNSATYLNMSPENVINKNRVCANESNGQEDDTRKAGGKWKSAKQKAGLGSGWDIVHTDPKGDNVRAVGSLFEAAGVDMRLFNTVDFDGNCYNPLDDAYIKPHYTDVREVSELTCTVTLSSPSDDGSLQSKSFPITSISHTEYAVKSPAVMDVGEYRLAAQGQMHYRQRLTVADLTDYDFQDLLERVEADCDDSESSPTVAYLEWDTGTLHGLMNTEESEARLRKATAGNETDTEVMKLVRSQTYHKTRSYYDITVNNFVAPEGSLPAVCVLTIKLDECQIIDAESMSLTCTGQDSMPTVEVDSSKLDSAGEIVLKIEGIEYWSALRISFEADTATYRVPDGVQLAKTVECLVANLKHADQPSSNNDPFWDDCKRLCFMSLCSAAYEMYDRAEDRNLNTVARLLDMAAPESGGWENMTPLAYLMKRWETGEDVPDLPEKDAKAGAVGIEAFKSTYKPKVAGEITWKRDPDRVPHSRSSSLAINCYRAYSVGAEDTVRSVIITCKAAFVSLFTPEIKKMIAKDEMRLTELGDANRAQAIFVVTKDTDSPFDFLTALLLYQTIDVLLDKAYARGGKLARHVRFEIDESMTIGKIAILNRALAVVRSRNMSISLYMQAKSQCQELYGEKVADSIFENVSVIKYLGSNNKDTNKELSEIIGEETIYSRITNRSWSGAIGASQVSESIQSQGRSVMSAADIRQMNRSKLIALASGMCAILDEKFHTSEHPYYPYVYTDHPRPLESPVARVAAPFVFGDYQARRDAKKKSDAE